MSTVMPEQGLPMPQAEGFTPQAGAPTDTPSPSLDAGLAQAPEATDAGLAEQGAPEQPAEPTTPQVSYEEFQRIQAQLQEKDGLLAQLQQMAEQQRRQEEEAAFNNGLRSRIKNDVAKRIANANDDDEITDAVYGLVEEVLGNTKQQYQSQVEQYHTQVEQALWSATKDGYADFLMKENGLPPSIKMNLLAFNDQNSMGLAAAQFKEALKSVQGQVAQQQVAQQVQERQASGVYAMGGANTGPTPSQPIQPGTAASLAPTLARIFGIPNRS